VVASQPARYALAIDYVARAIRRRYLLRWRRRAADAVAQRGDALLASTRHALRTLHGAWTRWRGGHGRRLGARVAARAFDQDLDVWRRRRLLTRGLARLRGVRAMDRRAVLAAGAMAWSLRRATAAVRRWRAWVRARQAAAAQAQLTTAVLGQLRLVRALRAWRGGTGTATRGRRAAEEAEAWDRALHLSRGFLVWRARVAWRRQRELAGATRAWARRWLRGWLLWAASRQARAEAGVRGAAFARARLLRPALARWRQGSSMRRHWAMAGVFRGRDAVAAVRRARLRMAVHRWAHAHRERRAAIGAEALRRRGLLAYAWTAWREEAATRRASHLWQVWRAQRAWRRWRKHVARSRREGDGLRRALWAWKGAREAAAWRRWEVSDRYGQRGWV
jgi:hypothetical protein